MLLESGADPNVQPYDTNQAVPLYRVAYHNRPEACELLLRFGANLDQRMGDGKPALDIAIEKKIPKLLQYYKQLKRRERSRNKSRLVKRKLLPRIRLLLNF